MSLIKEEHLSKELGKLDGWIYGDRSITKTYSFTTYMDSISFINRLAGEAEKNNHHPDMVVGWCKVVVAFTSHEKGGVTKECVIMAKRSDSVY